MSEIVLLLPVSHHLPARRTGRTGNLLMVLPTCNPLSRSGVPVIEPSILARWCDVQLRSRAR